jgi:hypothetical protein
MITLVSADVLFLTYASTLFSFESVLDTSTMLNPSYANYRQYSAPIPSDAPVTSAQGLLFLSFAGYFVLKSYNFGVKCYLSTARA